MKISPMDIQRQSFGRRFRGFDPDEVRAYLALVAEEVAPFSRRETTEGRDTDAEDVFLLPV